MPLINMIGVRCGRLVVMRRAHNSAAGHVMWESACDCGNSVKVDGRNLRSGHTQSCGCRLAEILQARATHGHTANGEYSDEFKTWVRIFTRCYNENEKGYDRYGGRGIEVCERWFVFANFFADMGRRPSPDHSIDRYPDNDGNYEPSNCRWATKKQQARNRRSSRIVEFRGSKMSLAEAVDISGLPYDTVKQRISKLRWSAKKALTEPVRGRS